MAQYEINNLPAPIDFECGNELIRRTLQNAKNLLMCRRGEVPYDRQRGFDPALFDLPLEEMNLRLLRELDRVMLWEPDVEVVSASAQRTEEGVVIRCVVEIALGGN